MHATLLLRPALRFAVHEDGAWEILSPWFPIVVFPSAMLQAADGRRVEVRGEMLYLHCTNGEAAYVLAPLAPGAAGRQGRLAWSRM